MISVNQDQVVQLVGSEHNRLTRAERNMENVVERCNCIDEDGKILKQKLARYQQQHNLHLEELLENMQVLILRMISSK